jgi:site-specific DNA-methyltransferase (adenine-specific)
MLMEIKINSEYSNLVPSVAKECFGALVDSIRINGLYEPITVNAEGYILDGHNRWAACSKLQLKAAFNIKYFKNQLEEKLYVIDVNLQRRQLTQAQRVQLCLNKKPILEEMAKLNQSVAGKSYGRGNNSSVQNCTQLSKLGRVNDIIARDSGVSTRQVSKIEYILSSASNELKQRVLNGTTNVNRAYNQLKLQQWRQELRNNAEINIEEGTQCQLFESDIRAKAMLQTKIPNDSVNLIYTDPPYDHNSLPLYKDLAILADRVLKEGGSLVTYIGQYALFDIGNYVLKNSSLKYHWELAVLHSGNQAPMFSKQIRVDWKPLLWFYKGPKPVILHDMHDSIKSEVPDKSLHDWAQSSKEARYCIEMLTYPGQVILDPFCGSGTTAIAALQLKRQFIGFDIDPDALQLAKININNYEKKHS